MDRKEKTAEPGRKTAVAALLVLALLATREGESFAEPRCPPAARVNGPAAVVSGIREILDRRGIRPEGGTGCPVTTARLRRVGAMIEVGVTDVYGRSSLRLVTDAETAVALIESWARTDMDASLLEPGNLQARPAMPKSSVEPEATVRKRPANPTFALDLLTSTTLASDGSFWIDGNLSGCVFFGPVCVGGLVKAAFDTGTTGESSKQGTGRVGLDVLLVADFPFRLGSLTLTPGMGVGAGWLRSSGGTGTGEERDDAEIDAGGLRLGASLRLIVPLGRSFSVELGLFADYSPLAHTSSFLQDTVVLAGEPRWYLRGGLGIRYGAR